MTTIRYSLVEQLPGKAPRTRYLKDGPKPDTVYLGVNGTDIDHSTSYVNSGNGTPSTKNTLFTLEFRPLHDITTILLRAVHDDLRILPPQSAFAASGNHDHSEGTPVNRWTLDEGVVFQLRPDDSFTVGRRKYTLFCEVVNRVEVASSAQGTTLVDSEGNDDEIKAEREDRAEIVSGTASTSVMIQDSINEAGTATSVIPQPNSNNIASTPHQRSFSDERVLETPALLSRYLEPGLDMNMVNSTVVGEAVSSEAIGRTLSTDPDREGVFAEILNGSSTGSMEKQELRTLNSVAATGSTEIDTSIDGHGKQEEESVYVTASERIPAPENVRSAQAIDGTPATTIVKTEEDVTGMNADTEGVTGSQVDIVQEQSEVSGNEGANYDEPASADLMDDVPGDMGESQFSVNTGAGRLLTAAAKGQPSTSSISGSQNDTDRSGVGAEASLEQSIAEHSQTEAKIPCATSSSDAEHSGKADGDFQHEIKNTVASLSTEQSEMHKDEDVETEDEAVEAGGNQTILAVCPPQPSNGEMKESISAMDDTTPATRNTRKRKSPPSAEPTGRSVKKRRRPTDQSEDSLEDSISVVARPQVAQSSSKGTQWTFPDSSVASEPTPSREGSRTMSATETAPYDGDPPRIVYSNSNIPSKPVLLKFLRTQKAKKVETVSAEGSDFLCVGSGELKKTTKLILSVALGKTVVTDNWVVDSSRAGHLLDPTPYLPSDPAREKLWGFNLKDAIERGKEGVQVFDGWTIYLTPSLKRELKDPKELQQIAVAAGADDVILHGPTKPAKNLSEKSLVLGSSEHDDDAAAGLVKKGWTLFDKEIVSLSMLRGSLAIESEEFKLGTHVSSQKSNSRRKVR
ncbi:MAG: hypothetical protein M1835_000616 [Candelina submexicana]|nr:MAG: hypothetical protein M1835_000616 [Candelina submexicana]